MKICYVIILIIVLALYPLSAQWVQTNGPKGGPIGDICKLSNNIFLYTNSSNVRISYDNCKTWTTNNEMTEMIFDSNLSNSVFNFINCIDEKIYIGTNYGLFFSNDSGKTFCSYKKDKIDGNVFDMCSNDDILLITKYDTLYCSTDKGYNWRSIPYTKFTYPSVQKIGLKWGKIFALNIGYQNEQYKWISGGVLISSDTGRTWNSHTEVFDKLDFTHIGFNDSTVIISNYSGGIFMSHNQGETWKNCDELKKMRINDIKSNDKYIFCATQNDGVIRSSDNGRTWESCNTGINKIRVNTILIDGNLVYIATARGLYISENNGNNWYSANDGIIHTFVMDMSINNDNIVIGGNDIGAQYSNDEGGHWTDITNDLPSKIVSKVITKGDTIYIANWNEGVWFKDKINGEWKNISSDLFSGQLVTTIFNTKDYLYASTFSKGIYRTSNNGLSWESVIFNNSTIKNMNALIEDNSQLYLSSYSHGILFSDDNGLTWELLNENINDSCTSLAINKNFIICGTSKGKIFKSNDRGKTWDCVKLSSDEVNVKALFIFGGKIFAALETTKPLYPTTVLISYDFGNSWYPINKGLEHYDIVKKFAIYNDYLYAATSRNGVWKAKLSDFDNIAVEEDKEKLIGNYLYAYPPYPMPAKDYVSSEIYWDSKLDINLADMAVYNFYGAKVCGKDKITLTQKSSWNGTVTWDATGMQPGVYFLQIKHGTRTGSIKMLIK